MLCGKIFEIFNNQKLLGRIAMQAHLLSFSFDLSHATFFLFLDQNFKMPLLNQFFMDFPKN